MSDLTETFDEVIETVDELEALKSRADKLGIKYHPKVGATKLKIQIEKHLSGETDTEEKEVVVMTEGQKKVQARKEAMKLVRVNVTCKDPNKKDYDGEIFTVANSVVGTVRKFVKFDTTEGYHVPQIILDTMRDKRVQIFKSTKDKHGNIQVTPKLIQAYVIEVLPPLTAEELKVLADDQRVRQAID